MSDDRWQRVKEIFEAALDRSGPVRDAFLDAECAGDEAMRAEVSSLLAASVGASGFLEGGADVPPSVAARTDEAAVRTAIHGPGVPSSGRTLPRRCPTCRQAFDGARRLCPDDGAVLEEDVDALVGMVLDGRFRIEAVLGRGGMSVVLRARHVALDDVVAIKLLDERFASVPASLRRFVREGQIARRFRHPAVVAIHDLVCEDDGPVYLVMEYVEGETLGACLRRRGQFPPRESIDLLTPVADALDAAHALGIVHRDLKPENVMLRASGEPRAKLLDLGIAIVHATDEQVAETRLTRQGHWIGTPLYMAPEQWMASDGMPGVDCRTDVYALGVVVYQLVAGRAPFTGDVRSVRAQHLEGSARRLDTAVAGVPRAFADAVARAMAKDPAGRFRTAGEFLRALDASLAGSAEAADDPESTTREGPAAVFASAHLAATELGYAATTGASEQVPGNLPAQSTSFVAPRGAIDTVVAEFDRSRCVTLTGPGGIGKTRLALEASARLEARFPNGVWLVELASIADPSLVSRAVADALGVRERPGEALTASIHDRIGDARLAIVLDNCEHVIDAAAALVQGLLRACPRAGVLATSRESLSVPAETVLPVRPLEVPPDGAPAPDVREAPAVHLFLDRVRSVAPSFDPGSGDLARIAAICRRLDGLPLAIELAAARVRALGVAGVEARLDDRFRLLAVSERGRESRQRTLHAAIDWSVRMLAEPERTLLCRLSVFAGGATLEAIERVCADPDQIPAVPRADVVDLVASLVGKSLVVADLEREPVRYRMLESIRAFALDALDASGERRAMEERVDAWVLAMARAFGAARTTPAQPAEDARVVAELDTVRQSFDRMMSRGDGGAALAAAAGSLGAFFESHGLLAEGRAWLDAAVAAGTSQPDRGLALYWSAVLAIDQGDYVGGGARLEAALDDARETGDRPAMARVLRALAYLSMRRNVEERAVALAREAAVIYAELGDVLGEAASAHLMATVEIGRGDYPAARPLLERIEVIHRQRRDDRSLAIDCYSLGEVLAGLGEFEAAEQYAAEAVAIAERMGDVQTLAYATYVVGWVAVERGDATAGLPAFRRALELAQSVGDDAASVYMVEGVASALALAGGGDGRTRAERAVWLGAAAAAHRQATDQPLSMHESSVLDRRLAPARKALPAEVLAAADARGSKMAFEGAVQEALGARFE